MRPGAAAGPRDRILHRFLCIVVLVVRFYYFSPKINPRETCSLFYHWTFGLSRRDHHCAPHSTQARTQNRFEVEPPLNTQIR